MSAESPQPLLEVRELSKTFTTRHGLRRREVRAVRGVSFDIRSAAITALVGESGSGKTTVARMLARLERPTGGAILLDGQEVDLRHTADRAFRRRVQMVLQDPFSSINPAHPVGYSLERAIRIHSTATNTEIRTRAASIMRSVELPPHLLDELPHNLSGGQRQRVAIARALATSPGLIIADEPTSMLDVSIRLGVLNLLQDLRDRDGVSLLYITHDLVSARYLADETMVMYAGELVEGGESIELMADPAHPYSRLLLSAVPNPRRRRTDRSGQQQTQLRRQVLEGTACPFGPDLHEDCSATTPVRHQLTPTHWVRCLRYPAQQGGATTALDELQEVPA